MSMIDLGVDSLESREVYKTICYFAKRSGIRDWEDLAQETYIKLWRYGLDTSKSKRSLIKISVKNLAVDLTYRYRSKLVGLTNTVDSHESFHKEIDHPYYDDHVQTIFDNFLKKLVPIERDVTVALTRMTYKQAATMLGVPIGTIKSCTNRVRIKARHYADTIKL